MKLVFSFLFIVLLAFNAQAQSKFTISGYIKDAANGEALIGATVYIKETGTGAITNEYGFYSLTLPAESYTLHYSYVGYSAVTKVLMLDKNNPLPTPLRAVENA